MTVGYHSASNNRGEEVVRSDADRILTKSNMPPYLRCISSSFLLCDDFKEGYFVLIYSILLHLWFRAHTKYMNLNVRKPLFSV